MKNKLSALTNGHILVLAISFIAVFVVFTSIWGISISSKGPLKSEKIVTIPAGMGAGGIGALLHKEGVIGTGSFGFKLNARLMFASKYLQAGSYKFPAEVSLRDVIKMLARGDAANFSVTIPEGLTVKEITTILQNAPHLTGEVDLKEIPEGSLLPETYSYGYNESRKAVVERMQKAMEKALDEAWNARIENLPLKNKEDLLTLASIVEKETAVEGERTEIAGVFTNRLKKRMRLQSDPTVIYGASNYKGDITFKHLKERHPYNTYTFRGLPKGPISNPGKASLMATANPKKTESLYFVADGSGGHVFSSTLEEHNRNVRAYVKYQKNLAKQGGNR